MQSILLISNNISKRQEFLTEFAKEHHISQFDVTTIEPSETSFGIADVRNLQKTAYLAPGHGKEKMIVLEKAELLTPEAQNALLKLLEEPPQNTYILLSAISENSFLPTITSRCNITFLKEEREEVSEEKKNGLITQLEMIGQGSIGNRLALAEKIAADKENLTTWFTQSILLLRENLLKEPENKQILNAIIALQDAYKNFQTTHISPRVILEHTFLLF